MSKTKAPSERMFRALLPVSIKGSGRLVQAGELIAESEFDQIGLEFALEFGLIAEIDTLPTADEADQEKE